MTPEIKPKRPLTRPEAIQILWHKGLLHWKLHKGQFELYQSYHDAKHRTMVWSCSRRLGKSFALCLLAVEACLKKPNAVVKYIAPQQKQVRTIIAPILREILKDCPSELQPKFMSQHYLYRFKNGSEIQLAGADNGNAEMLRGGSSDLCIVDEAGFVDDLEYVVQSVLLPTTATTGGKIILASTPSKTADHPFMKYVERAEERGTLVTKTIYDNPMLTPEAIKELMEEAGGAHTVSWKREYLCQRIVDDNFAVVPEFTPELEAKIVREWERPPYFDTYVAMDLGVTDFTFVLFAYYDFEEAKLIIEDEFVLNGQKWNTEKLAEGIKSKEKELWTNPLTGELKPVLKHICDINPAVRNDLRDLHGLDFMQTNRDDADAALNNMKVKLGQMRIIINPRCKRLIHHIKYAIWNKSRTKMERSADNGHYDGVDALKYLVRNVNFNKNPYPAYYDRNLSPDRTFIYNERSSGLDVYKKLFNIKRK